MSAVASQKLGPEVLLIFLGHSSDADILADAIYDLERELQRLLDQHLSVSKDLPFKSVRIWEWRKDGLPVVGGQDKVVADAIMRANIAVFVFKERIGTVSWDELNKSRNKEDPTIPVLAFFPIDSPPDLNDVERIAKWLELVKKRNELVKDWSDPNSKSLRPMEKYKDAAHLTTLATEHLSNAVVSLLKCGPTTKESIPEEILPVSFLGDHSHLSYDRQPVLKRSLDELDQDLLKELLAKPLSQDLNANLKNGRDGSSPAPSEQLENLGCLFAGRPTLGALLCFAPTQILADKSGCCTLQMAIHDGSERGGERASLSLTRGNLLLLYKQGMSWLTGGSVLRRRGQIGADTRDDLEIPEIVLREALANALVHRDYESKVLQDQPTRIDVYPDKVEITSYGLLLKEVPIELLNNPDQSLRPFRRNPVIAGIFQCMTLAELNASGVQRMRRVMTSGGLPLPLFRTSDNFVCVTLARPFDLSNARELVQSTLRTPRTTRKAFISSTMELAEQRKAAQDACLRSGVIPIMPEVSSLAGAEITSALNEMIGDSDLCIFILGNRYGSIPAHDGISFTELEFTHAIERGLPILAFTMHADHPVTAGTIESDVKGREKLALFKERLTHQHMWSEFKSPEDLRSQIIETLAMLPDIKRRFRVALSFVGEKREFVAKVAALLAQHFGESSVLFDKFHEAEFARPNLSIYLPRLYNESELVVAVLTPNYNEKTWVGLDWSTINELAERGRQADVMLCRFDKAKIEDLHGTAGFLELDDKTPEQFATLILERLAVNEGLHKDHYTQLHTQHLTPPPSIDTYTSSFPIPHNLPALQPFFGREDELQQIAVALEPESRTWGALIDGPGGMGKTSLAVRAAFSVQPGSFDRIVFVSLKSRELDDEGLRDLSGFVLSGLTELFGELARQLGRDDILKQAEDQRPRLLLEALRGTRALLLLDNLESLLKTERDTVFTFVKRLPPGCKAILTSRGRVGSGAAELILGKLSEVAALQTLAELATHNQQLAKTSEAERLVLYRATGGAPLLLRWTAGQIGRGHCHTFVDAIAYLRSCPPGNDPLEFILGDLVEDFSPAETQALCTLTYFTQPAGVEHIAAIAAVEVLEQSGTAAGKSSALTVEEIDRALRSLANRSLVIPSSELQTFTLVPLVADFLRNKKPEVIAATGSRLEQRAYALILENGLQNHDRFPLLEAAWPSVAPALPLFLAGSNDRLQEVCDALDVFLDFTGRWDEWLALSQQAEARAATTGDHRKAGWRAFQAGWVHFLRGQAEAVLACADSAAAHWQKAFPPGSPGGTGIREHACALRLRGIGHQLQKNSPAAITAYRQVVELDRSSSAESADMAMALNSLAGAERLSGDLDAAEHDFREALRVARSVGHSEGVAYCTGNLALLALDREAWPLAESLAREALALSEKLGRQELIAADSRLFAKALAQQGRGAEGLPHALRAVEIYTRLGSPGLADAQLTLRECETAREE